MCYEYVRIKPHEFRRETGQMLGASLRPAVVDQDIPSFVVPQITQPLSERLEIGCVVPGRRQTEEADAVHFCCLLRLGAQRCKRQGEGEHQDDPPQWTPRCVMAGGSLADA